jgi:hypothetical protein
MCLAMVFHPGTHRRLIFIKTIDKDLKLFQTVLNPLAIILALWNATSGSVLSQIVSE